MSIYLVPPHTPSHKPSFTHNLHHFALNQCWVPHQDSTALEHEAAVLKEPLQISGDHFGKVAEEKMDFRGAILSFDQPLLTKTDIILDKELVGQPISLQESDYTPAIPASPSSPIPIHPCGYSPSLVYPRMITSWKTLSWREDPQFIYLTLICHFREKCAHHCSLCKTLHFNRQMLPLHLWSARHAPPQDCS